MDKKYTLLLPIAGNAQRFVDAGYTMPKPLIMVGNKHIINWALSSINYTFCDVVFIVKRSHINVYAIDEILYKKFGKDIKIVVAEQDTRGSVETCLLAEDFINLELPLIVYTPDVFFEPVFDPSKIDTRLDGFILTFKANNPAHSYVKLDDRGDVVKTAEKQVISENAAVGIYYFKTGNCYVKYAKRLIADNIRTNNEFYICPIYNMLISDGMKIQIDQIEKMHVLGTPIELEFFINAVIARFGIKPVALCCDHSGFVLKEQAKEILVNHNIAFVDYGTYVKKDCDYNDYVSQAVAALGNKTCDFALGFCRTGQGINMLANKEKNVRGALVYDEYTARYAIKHNCANFFSIPSKDVTKEQLSAMVDIWMTTTFDGGRHLTRMKKTMDK